MGYVAADGQPLTAARPIVSTTFRQLSYDEGGPCECILQTVTLTTTLPDGTHLSWTARFPTYDAGD